MMPTQAVGGFTETVFIHGNDGPSTMLRIIQERERQGWAVRLIVPYLAGLIVVFETT